MRLIDADYSGWYHRLYLTKCISSGRCGRIHKFIRNAFGVTWCLRENGDFGIRDLEKQ